MASASTNRSKDRSVAVGIRLSPEDREVLRHRAADAGMTIQAFIEWKALGRETPIILRNGRPPVTQEPLPMTG